MTIEHVSPEKPPAGTSVEPGVGRLGNLLLLDHPTNDDVGNKPFLPKQKAYVKAGVPLDDTLRLATKWGTKEIDARTTALGTLGYNKIFRV